MLYGVISDVHANLEALDSCLSRLAAAGAEAYVCCGDSVGYGPDPNACVERIRALPGLTAIVGNHDLAAIGRLDQSWFNQFARTAIIWTGAHLSADNRAFLGEQTARLETPDFSVAHGTPRNPVEEYLLTGAQFEDNAPLVSRWPLFVGHTHIPMLFRFGGGRSETHFLEDGEEVELQRAGDGAVLPAALNPGSVGQPRDQDRRASCGLYDSAKRSFRVFRVEYDVRAVQAKIRAAGLPEYLALRLDHGQ